MIRLEAVRQWRGRESLALVKNCFGRKDFVEASNGGAEQTRDQVNNVYSNEVNSRSPSASTPLAYNGFCRRL